MPTVKVINISKNKLPQYETKGSAGMDIRVDLSRVTPDNPIKGFGNAEVIWAGEAHNVPMVRLSPGSRALLPTGLFSAIPEGYQISLRPRSGLSIKQGVTLCNSVGLVDSDYRLEWFVPVINLGQEDVYIEDGERICQALLEKVNRIEWEKVESLDETERVGGFGSTGIK
jgi:dUTP pyrophosphatase